MILHGVYPNLLFTREFTTNTVEISYRAPVDQIYRTMEMYVGLICACLLTFPPFIDRYGPRLVTRLRSYTTFQWRTTRETPASSLRGKPNRNGSFSRININEYTDLGNGAGPIMMHNIGTETVELVNSSTYKATVAHETC